MHLFLPALLTIGGALATSNAIPSALQRRQLDIRAPVPIPSEPETCAAQYGSGNIACESSGCYNPSAGESCCANGDYCDAGYYCTNTRCCPEGESLESCGAAATTLQTVSSGGLSYSANATSNWWMSGSGVMSATRGAANSSTSGRYTATPLATTSAPSSVESTVQLTTSAATSTSSTSLASAASSTAAQQTPSAGYRREMGLASYMFSLLLPVLALL